MSRDAILSRAIAPNRLVSIIHGGQVYTTRVESADAEEFAVSAPYDGATPVPFRVGDAIDIQVENDAGQIRFRSRVRDRQVRGVPVLAVEWPETYQRQQRREYVRVPVRLPVTLVVPEKEKTPEQRYPAQTRDLGGGGLQVLWVPPAGCPDLLGQKIAVIVDLSDGLEPVRATGTVVRARETGAGQGSVSELGIEFTQISERDRNRVCRHIFNRQIDLRRRGLL